MKNKTISEYGYIYYDVPRNLNNKFVHKEVTESEFNELYQYWKENDDAKSVFEYSGYKYLKAQNFVGIIQTKNLSVEILPKIYDNNSDKNKVRIIFIEMLKPLLNINEVQINKAQLSTTKNKNIYEMFITLFVQSMDTLIHKGIKSDYILREGNQFFLKGKLKFNQHIKQNYIHKERFYVETDEYLQDRVANRLLKSTIALLLKKTNNYDNKRKLRQQLFIFDEVQLSNNHENESKDCDTVNVSSGDVYQIFSYLHFYEAQNTAYIFVPKIEDKNLENKEFTYLINKNSTMKSEKKKLKIISIDLDRLINKEPRHELSKNIFKVLGENT